MLLDDNRSAEQVRRRRSKAERQAEDNGMQGTDNSSYRFLVLSHAAGRMAATKPLRMRPTSDALSNNSCPRSESK